MGAPNATIIEMTARLKQPNSTRKSNRDGYSSRTDRRRPVCGYRQTGMLVRMAGSC